MLSKTYINLHVVSNCGVLLKPVLVGIVFMRDDLSMVRCDKGLR